MKKPKRPVSRRPIKTVEDLVAAIQRIGIEKGWIEKDADGKLTLTNAGRNAIADSSEAHRESKPARSKRNRRGKKKRDGSTPKGI